MPSEDAERLGAGFGDCIAAERDRIIVELEQLGWPGAACYAHDPIALAAAEEAKTDLERLIDELKQAQAAGDRTAYLALNGALSAVEERLNDMLLEDFQRNAKRARVAELLHRIEVIDLSREHHDTLAQREQLHKAERAVAIEAAGAAAAQTVEKALGALHRLPAASTVASIASDPLSAVLEAYCTSQRAERQWTEKTEQENRGILGMWLTIVGDRPIAEYGAKDHREYRAKLLRLPPNVNKNPRFKGLSIAEVLALNTAPAKPATAKKAFTRVSAMLGWARANGHEAYVPDARMRIKNPKRAVDARAAFSDDDLRALFHKEAFLRPKEPYRHWVPLIALYTGARVNEIAQLHLSDFVEFDGVATISINDKGEGKRLKTAASERLVPLHPDLIKLGLLGYVEQLRERGETRLFPELPLSRDGYGQTVSRWFSRHCKRCGVTGAGKAFHSFRHTFSTRLDQAGARPDRLIALVGHEQKGTTFQTYVKTSPPGLLLETVRLLDFDWLVSMLPGYTPEASQ